jgi:hypothetical protein
VPIPPLTTSAARICAARAVTAGGVCDILDELRDRSAASGSMPTLTFSVSASSAGSFIALSKPSRSACTRLAGVPGAAIGRSISSQPNTSVKICRSWSVLA